MIAATQVADRKGVVLAHLREVTAPAHRALEAGLGLLDDDLSLDDYRRMLARFYGFWKGWEPQVALALGDRELSEPRRRLHLLSADLAALGLTAETVDRLPFCPLTTLIGPAEALGSLYVMEGSSLGGRIIQRHVERCLGEAGRGARAYFTGYGDGTGLMWRSFLARLDDEPVANATRIGQGAVATFERLGWWLTVPSPRLAPPSPARSPHTAPA